jgi:hypothetical protein
MEAWREMGDPLGWRPPLSWKVSAGLALRHRTGGYRPATSLAQRRHGSASMRSTSSPVCSSKAV